MNTVDKATSTTYLNALSLANTFFDRYRKIPKLFELLKDIKAAEQIASKLEKFGVNSSDLINKWLKNDTQVKNRV